MASNCRPYYEVLHLNFDATPHDIRRAYSEAIEPSIANGTYGDSEESKTVIDAYEILSDHKTRRFYDRYGTLGVIIRNTYTGRFLHPQLIGLSLKILLLRAGFLLSTFYFLEKLKVEIEFAKELNFGLMILPLVINLVVLFILLLYILYCGRYRLFMTPGYVDFISPWLGDPARIPTFTKFIRWHRLYLAETVSVLTFLSLLLSKLYIIDVPSMVMFSPILLFLFLEKSFIVGFQFLVIAIKLDFISFPVSWWIIFSPSFVGIIWEICTNVVLCSVFLVFALHDRTVPTVGLHRRKLVAELVEQILSYLSGLGLLGFFLVLLAKHLDGHKISMPILFLPLCFGLKLLLVHCALIPFIIVIAYFRAPIHSYDTPTPVQFATVPERPPLLFIDDEEDYEEEDPLLYSNSVTGYGTSRIF